ncbi:MAG: hypothetical protein ICV87_01245 [Gemmatimonadetes bacterium]|nr:hypothetical protein [Gemmatimonadota bacterium]
MIGIAMVIVVGVMLPGAIGVGIARAWGFPAWMGFAAGALGGIGGWMLIAALPRRGITLAPIRDLNEPARGRRLAAADRAANLLYRVAGVGLVALNLVWLATTFAALLFPLGLGPLMLAEPGGPIRSFDVAFVVLLAVLWLLCIYTAAADRRLTRGARAGWLTGIVVVPPVAPLVYVPWRRTRLLGRP